MRVFTLFLATIIAGASASSYAQEAAPPAHIAFVDGSAVVYHAGGDPSADPRSAQADSEPAVINMPIVAGDRVRTLARARVDVMFPDGTGIAIDPDSDVEFLSATRVRVVAGAIEHHAAPSLDPRSPSTQNLPPDLQAYGPEFDQNGSWQNEPSYGNVWYPTSVSADWRPYYDGYWSSYPSYGWTWVGYERWAWPTHHYGRWGYARSRWFWIPGRSFAAAWVSWGTAPDYVSWCPLGYDGRAVIGLSVGFRSSWNAWTVIPRDRFGARGYSARRYAIEPQRIAASTAFIEHRTAPARDRRGSFSGNGDQGGRRVNDDRTSGGVGTAVPRGDYRAPSTDYRRRADTVQNERRATDSGRVFGTDRGTIDQQRGTSNARPTPGNERQATSNDRRAPSASSPSYQPRSEPRYQPRYEPTYQAPRAQPSYQAPRAEPIYRDRRPTGGDGRVASPEPRPSTQPRRESREMAAPSSPTPAPRRSEAAPSRGERQSSAPARESHSSGRDSRSQEGSSHGSAVRRPR